MKLTEQQTKRINAAFDRMSKAIEKYLNTCYDNGSPVIRPERAGREQRQPHQNKREVSQDARMMPNADIRQAGPDASK
jgi:hypothetical protein